MRRWLTALLCAALVFAPAVFAQAPPPPPDAAMAPEPTPTPSAAPAVSAPTTAFDPSATPSPAAVFGFDYMQRALVAGVAVGAVCAYLGVFVVLRRVVFVVICSLG